VNQSGMSYTKPTSQCRLEAGRDLYS